MKGYDTYLKKGSLSEHLLLFLFSELGPVDSLMPVIIVKQGLKSLLKSNVFHIYAKKIMKNFYRIIMKQPRTHSQLGKMTWNVFFSRRRSQTLLKEDILRWNAFSVITHQIQNHMIMFCIWKPRLSPMFILKEVYEEGTIPKYKQIYQIRN